MLEPVPQSQQRAADTLTQTDSDSHWHCSSVTLWHDDDPGTVWFKYIVNKTLNKIIS